MRYMSKQLLLFGLFLLSLAWSMEYKRVLEVPSKSNSWVIHDGKPIYYSSDQRIYSVDNQSVSPLVLYDPKARIEVSPNAEYRVFHLLQDMDLVKEGIRYADYFVLDNAQNLLYKTTRGTEVDLKPLVPAISNNGTLALVDAVQAKLYLYAEGELTSEGQIFETQANYGMERNVQVEWHQDKLYILMEDRGRVLFIHLDDLGRQQRTYQLPFASLQDHVFSGGRFFISGYSYDPEEQEMNPLIVEVSTSGKVLWTNKNFGHELEISENGRYLAALSGHESVQIFDLETDRVNNLSFPHENLAALGLTVNNEGQTAVIRVPVDFFVKKNTYFAQIFFPQLNASQDIQIDPRYRDLFQLHSDGRGFFLGTNYEWLEIRP